MSSLMRMAAAAAGLLALAIGVPGAAALTIPQARPFGGVPYTGALFQDSGGVLGRHFCTAAVVASPAGNLLISSAHCLSGEAPATVAFAPGYHSGQFPYGTFPLTRIFTNQAWATHHNIDDDVAFLRVGTDIQKRTGALALATGIGPRMSTVIGYPDGQSRPVTCTARATWHTRLHQMKFVCGGYPDGTSGGPWITGGMRVNGVIGGYQMGGRVSWISYSPYFGQAIRSLYNQAVGQSS